MTKAVIGCIRLYQRFVSPWMGQNCRFYPSCSQYAVDALKVHGLILGSFYALGRILRCQPFSEGGYDPVEEKPTHSHAECDSQQHS